tara:strand:- start:142 stop:471 length:330 start_codon:yes stop_codon:yes gene_type:complete
MFLKPNMENSPLRFLDYDVSLMLADQVRLSQEEEVRKFHTKNLEKKNEYINYHNINLLSVVFSNIYSKIEIGEAKEKRLGYVGPWTRLIERPYFIRELYEREKLRLTLY